MAEQFLDLGIPYAWGFAIIALTLVIKLVTLPLAIRQVQSSKRMQEVQPQLQALQKKYAGNKERLAQEQMKLYKEAGVNPLGGCLPSLVQLPIWIGLYQALNQLAHNGTLVGGFFWLKDLSFPNPQVGTSWLWPANAANPNWQGWFATIGYLVLPILTIVTQVVTQKMMTPTSGDQSQGAMNSVMMFMPFMFGFFALTFPSGLALYWVTSNLFTMIQQWLLGPKPASASEPTKEPGVAIPPDTPEKEEPEQVLISKRVPRQTPKKRTRDGRRRRRS
ncbi:MAG: YidC/Oxa1 family membrane protein insertase [Anaerolineae bacterium]